MKIEFNNGTITNGIFKGYSIIDNDLANSNDKKFISYIDDIYGININFPVSIKKPLEELTEEDLIKASRHFIAKEAHNIILSTIVALDHNNKKLTKKIIKKYVDKNFVINEENLETLYRIPIEIYADSEALKNTFKKYYPRFEASYLMVSSKIKFDEIANKIFGDFVDERRREHEVRQETGANVIKFLKEQGRNI